mgnify:CR=1 FL=1
MKVNNSPEEKTTSLTFVWDIWVLFPEKLEAREDIANQLVNLLKKLCCEKFLPLKVWANAQMFRLLDLFAEQRNQFAPTIFKNLAYSLVENHEDSTTREYIMKNMISMFENIPTIPVGFVVDPLVKLLQESEGDTYFYNTIDFDFLCAIAKHPKLQPRNALQLIDIFA